MAKDKGLRRVKEYRRALASLPDETVGTALAAFVFSSLSQKRRFAEAMQKVEGDPGFAGWGAFASSKPARAQIHTILDDGSCPVCAAGVSGERGTHGE